MGRRPLLEKTETLPTMETKRIQTVALEIFKTLNNLEQFYEMKDIFNFSSHLKARHQVIPKWAIYGIYVKNQKISVSYKCCENFKRFTHLVLEISEIKVFTVFHGTTIYGSPTSI